MMSSDVTARGMDFPDVTLVLQIGLPSAREQYIHRLAGTSYRRSPVHCAEPHPVSNVRQSGTDASACVRWHQAFALAPVPSHVIIMPSYDAVRIVYECILSSVCTSSLRAPDHLTNVSVHSFGATAWAAPRVQARAARGSSCSPITRSSSPRCGLPNVARHVNQRISLPISSPPRPPSSPLLSSPRPSSSPRVSSHILSTPLSSVTSYVASHDADSMRTK
jgi:hypothetical protein